MRTCPTCGRAYPESALDGICPSCSLQQALADDAPPDGPGLAVAEPNAPNALGVSLVTRTSFPDPSGHFGDYELLEEIGRGGMGIVFKARQKSLDRIVAVKMLLPDSTSHRDYMIRFRTEASAAAGLQHPNIVAIHEVGAYEGRPFFVMDYVEGRSLALTMAGPGWRLADYRRSAQWLQTVAEAIQVAHDHGVLHRDLKPSNILIDRSGQPRVTDFGLAKRLVGDTSLTLSGQLLGSPSYMPPEQAAARHGKVSRRSDVYGLGATLYHLLTGRAPFQAATITETLDEVLNKEPVAPRVLSSGIPRDLETICLKCLQKDPHRRYANARELADELGRFLRGEPILTRPIGVMGQLGKWCRRRPAQAALSGSLAVVIVVGVLVVVWEWRQSELQRVFAESQQARAEASERLAAQRAYDSDMNLAQRALAEFNLGGARELLERHRSEGKAETDLRGWEWRYLWQQARGSASEILIRSANPFCALSLSSDGKWLAVREYRSIPAGSASDRITLWDLPRRRRVGHVRTKGWHRALAISTSLNLLAAAEFERFGPDRAVPIRLWDLTTLEDVGQLPHPEGINCLALSADGRQLATHAADEQLRVWDLTTRRELKRYPASMADVTWMQGCLAFSPDGNQLVFGDPDSRINRIIDLRTDREDTLTSPAADENSGGAVNALALSPDGRRLAVNYGFGATPIELWDLAAGKCLHALSGHRASLLSVVFTPDGRTLASASADQTIRLWDVEKGQLIRVLTGHTDDVVALAMLPDGDGLVSASADGSVRLWKLQSPESRRDPITVAVRRQPFRQPFALLPDSRSILCLDPDGSVAIRSVVTGELEERLTELGTNRQTVAVSPNGRWAVAGGPGQLLSVWDLRQRSVVTNTTIRTGDCLALNFDSRGRILRVQASGGTLTRASIRLVDTRDWREVGSWNLELGNLDGLAWSPDDRLAALGAQDGTITWWDAVGGRELEVTQGPSANATATAFSPDGRWLAAASWSNGRLILWDTTTRRVGRPPLRAHVQSVVSVAFSPDGRRLVTGGMLPEEGIKIWNFHTQSVLLTLPAPRLFTVSTAFSPDGNSLVATAIGYPMFEGSLLCLWHAPSWDEIAAAERER